MISFRKAYGFNDLWLMVFGIPVVSVIMAAILFNDVLISFNAVLFSRCILVSMVYVTIYWLVFRVLFVYFRGVFPHHKDVAKRLILQTIAIIVIYILVRNVIKITIHDYLHDYAGSLEKEANLAIEPLSSLMITFLVISIYEGIYFFNQLRQSILEKEQLQKAHVQSQLEGLKSQVNPHFLFNSLNTLAHLIPEDTDRALRFVQKLSQSYRYILEIRNEKLINLSEELDFLKAFVFLLQERFGDNLRVTIEVPSVHLQAKVIPLSLQLLVENAIKHNIISKSRPLEIQIYIEDDRRLVVENNLQVKNQTIHSTKMGLENIKTRYRFYSDQSVEVRRTDHAFTVALPLIHSEQLALKS